jgi:CBS domain-containing protein
METGYKVGEIMVGNVSCVDPDVMLIDCAREMAEKRVGCLIVIDNEKVIGIITEQDLARKVLAKGLDATSTRVSEVMSTTVHKIHPAEDIYNAFQLMGINEIKHLPVIDGENLVGIITSKDVLAIQPGLIELLSFKRSGKR